MPEEIIEQETKMPRKKISKKLLISAIAAVVVIAVLLAFVLPKGKKEEGYEYIRTTTLSRTSLSEVVTVNGTVSASDTATVTVAESAKYYKIATVNVKVGDVVKEGDIIATLDTTDLEKSINKAQDSYSDAVSSTQKAYDRASSSYKDALESQEDALDGLADVRHDAREAKEETESAKNAAVKYYNAIKTIYNNAVNSIKDERESYENAQKEYEEIKKAFYEGSSIDQDGNILRGEVTEEDVSKAEEKMNTAKNTLDNAKSICSATDPNGINLFGFDAIEAAYENALKQKEAALGAFEKAADAYEKARDTYDKAEEESAELKRMRQGVEDALDSLNNVKENTDQLDNLYDTVDECTLKATMDGTITEVNAVVGSTCMGTVATIQNLDSLIVEVTVSANDIAKLKVGMECNITSDATENTVKGELYQIDPVAGMNGSFGAKVRVIDENSGLLAGISAQVEIIVKSTEGVFSVPLDAIGTEENGSSYVLRKTGGSGIDMTFEHVAVTVGESTDFYCEIIGADLSEGDVIRSSSDLSEGIVSSDQGEDDIFTQMMDMASSEPRGNTPGNRPSGGPGGM